MKTGMRAFPLAVHPSRSNQCVANTRKRSTRNDPAAHVQVRASCAHPTFAEMAGTVSQVLDEDAHTGRAAFVSRTQQCFAVRSGLDSFLDLARQAFCRASDDVHALAADYRDAHDMPGLRVRSIPWGTDNALLADQLFWRGWNRRDPH